MWTAILLFSQSGLARPTVNYLYSGKPGLGSLDEPKSAKPAQRSCRTGPPVYLGWNRRLQPVQLAGWFGYSAEWTQLTKVNV
jgi:hypothetical protein